jgi:integrase
MATKMTVAQVVDLYLADRKTDLKASSLPSVTSLLRGSSARGGRKAMGTPLATSNLGRVYSTQLTEKDLKEWFAQRCPEQMGDHAKRRNAHQFNHFLTWSVEREYMPAEALRAKRKGVAGPQNRHWLDPEQVSALSDLVAATDTPEFDSYRRLLWATLINLGLRTFEVPKMKPRDIDARAGTVTVPAGKGRGAGKERVISTDPVMIEMLMAHVREHGLKADHLMFFRRDFKVSWRAAPARRRVAHGLEVTTLERRGRADVHGRRPALG